MKPITRLERRTVVADANVLYSNEQRNVLVTLSIEGVIGLRWTDEIQNEWVRNLLKNNPGVQRENIERTCRLMCQATGNTHYKDKHVAAAALACAPSSVATWNLRDFDKDALSAAGVHVEDPDEFLCDVYDLSPTAVHDATQKAYGYVRKNDGKPSWSDYLDILTTRGAPCSLKRFAEKLRHYVPEDNPTDDDSAEPNIEVVAMEQSEDQIEESVTPRK